MTECIKCKEFSFLNTREDLHQGSGVRACPNCEDKPRDGAEVRKAKSRHHTDG